MGSMKRPYYCFNVFRRDSRSSTKALTFKFEMNESSNASMTIGINDAFTLVIQNQQL